MPNDMTGEFTPNDTAERMANALGFAPDGLAAYLRDAEVMFRRLGTLHGMAGAAIMDALADRFEAADREGL